MPQHIQCWTIFNPLGGFFQCNAMQCWTIFNAMQWGTIFNPLGGYAMQHCPMQSNGGWTIFIKLCLIAPKLQPSTANTAGMHAYLILD